jgi:hypothetical protein
VTHHLQLLVVRAERASKNSRAGSSAAAAAEDSSIAKPGGADQAASASQGLRQRLGLLQPSHYAERAAAVSDPLESTRCVYVSSFMLLTMAVYSC